jgi:hypothetical protein
MSDRDGKNKFKNFSKMSVTEQRNITRDYLANKVKEIKVKYQSQTDIVTRFGELIKM